MPETFREIAGITTSSFRNFFSRSRFPDSWELLICQAEPYLNDVGIEEADGRKSIPYS